MQLALLLDCCASGVFSGRRIGRAIYRHICGAVLYRRLLRSALPHCTLRRHRREATPAVLEQVLALAQALELLPLGTLRLDEPAPSVQCLQKTGASPINQLSRCGPTATGGRGPCYSHPSRASPKDEVAQKLPPSVARHQAVPKKIKEACRAVGSADPRAGGRGGARRNPTPTDGKASLGKFGS